jgi:TRAP-type C4-dicarboxylate transport system substrate-binding protein
MKVEKRRKKVIVIRRIGAAFLATAAVAVFLGGCSDDGGATKAGGTGGAPVTLRIGTDDFPGKPASNQIEEFARRVEAMSGGKIRIEPVWHAAGDGPDWDQRVARMVMGGELDMGLIPSRSWDTEGITSLRALNAPFLITSDELLADVVAHEMATEMMSGLTGAGVVGLALFPEGMRHPFGLKKALRSPDDYAGEVIRTPTSNTTAAVFEALGATTNDEEPQTSVHAAVESSYVLEPIGISTGNITFYPKVNSLVINADAYDGLEESQLEILKQAAEDTRTWAIDESPSDVEAAETFCEQGGSIVLASDEDVAALERTTEPVYAELERDDQTEGLIQAIQALKQDASEPATIPACEREDSAGGSEAGDEEISELDGIYRFETTDEQLREARVTDPDVIAENHGLFTMTLSGGDYCWEQKAPNPVAGPIAACGTYEIDGDRFIFNFPDGRQPDIYRWRKTGDGDLKLTALSAAPGDLPIARAWTASLWIRVGDAE